jgi:hypothetical protein
LTLRHDFHGTFLCPAKAHQSNDARDTYIASGDGASRFFYKKSFFQASRKKLRLILVFYFDYLLAVIISASSANSVALMILTALGAFGQAGHFKLPDVGTSFVASCLADLSLRYCHLSAPPYKVS